MVKGLLLLLASEFKRKLHIYSEPDCIACYIRRIRNLFQYPIHKSVNMSELLPLIGTYQMTNNCDGSHDYENVMFEHCAGLSAAAGLR